jgi:release factor glutamine methyltransferase
MTISRASIRDAAAVLAKAGVPSPEHDAQAIADHVNGDDALFAAAIERRAAREPLQHIIGVAYFRHIGVAVGPGVFVPRPETELVAGAAIDWLRANNISAPTVVDLCAGSGAIALSVADEIPGATVYAVELDPVACEWAEHNAAGTPVRVQGGDAADALPELEGLVDAVVSNPPYLPDSARKDIEPEVGEHDPALALWGGPDGLAVIPVVVRRAAGLLRPGGLLVVEHDESHASAVIELLADEGGWVELADHSDLTGRPRYTTAVHA